MKNNIINNKKIAAVILMMSACLLVMYFLFDGRDAQEQEAKLSKNLTQSTDTHALSGEVSQTGKVEGAPFEAIDYAEVTTSLLLRNLHFYVKRATAGDPNIALDYAKMLSHCYADQTSQAGQSEFMAALGKYEQACDSFPSGLTQHYQELVQYAAQAGLQEAVSLRAMSALEQAGAFGGKDPSSSMDKAVLSRHISDLEQLSDNGHEVSMSALAEIHRKGIVVPKNDIESIAYSIVAEYIYNRALPIDTQHPLLNDFVDKKDIDATVARALLLRSRCCSLKI